MALLQLSISASTAILFWDWNLHFQPMLRFPQRVQNKQDQTHRRYSSQHLLLGVSDTFLNIGWTVILVCCPHLLFPTILKLFLVTPKPFTGLSEVQNNLGIHWYFMYAWAKLKRPVGNAAGSLLTFLWWDNLYRQRKHTTLKDHTLCLI